MTLANSLRKIVRTTGILIAGFALLIACSKQGMAQNVTIASEFLADTNSSYIDTYWETTIDDSAAAKYSVAIGVGLYQNGVSSPIRWGCMVAAVTANSEAYGATPYQTTTAGSDYELQSDHYLLMKTLTYDGDTGAFLYWNNPSAYKSPSSKTVYSSNQLSGAEYTLLTSGVYLTPGGGPARVDNTFYGIPGCPTEYPNWLYIGSTVVNLSTAAPSITSMSPTSGSIGTSDGAITVQGTALTNVFDGKTTPQMMNAIGNLTPGFIFDLTKSTFSSDRVTLDYSIDAATAAPGAQSFTLKTPFGTTAPISFQIGDPSPSIQGMQPSIWNAGTANLSVTITGTGFGTNPSITVTGTGISGCSGVTMTQPGAGCSIQSVTTSQVQQIAMRVSIATNGSGSASVQVQSNGYDGNGFVSTQPGQSGSASATAQIQAQQQALPVPQIMLGPNTQGGAGICQTGTNIAPNPQNVVVGQRIAFTGCVPASVASQVTSESWTPAAPGDVNALAGFSVSTDGSNTETITNVSQTTCGTAVNCDFNPFYFVTSHASPTSYKFTFSYTTVQGAASVDVTFVVSGPSNLVVSTQIGAVVPVPPPSSIDSTLWELSPYNVTYKTMPVTGVIFQVTAATLPSTTGKFQWTQLITHDTAKISGTGLSVAKCTGLYQPNSNQVVFNLPPQLDTAFPYPGTHTTADGPAVNDLMTDLPSMSLSESNGVQYAEAARNFAATTYLMWIPQLDGSIPVPLGSIQWGVCGDAINTLSSQTSPWITMPCTSGSSTPAFVAGSAYPLWTYATQFGETAACVASSY